MDGEIGMTTGDDLRKIGTGRSGAPRSGGDGGAPEPVLEARRRQALSALERRRGPREGHALDRVNRLRSVLLSMAGGLLGFVLGMFAAGLFPGAPLAVLYPFIVGGLMWGLVYLCVEIVTGGAGGLASTIYAPGGRGAPRREYSLAESLVARGRYEDAVSAFEMAVAEHPDDPVPYLRIARISRDHLEDPGEAARWFGRAREEASLSEGQWRTVTRELVELHQRTGRPTRAAPELARLAELHPGTREGEWARRELADLKKVIAEEMDSPGPREPPPS